MARILVITDNYPPKTGGIASVVHLLCTSLAPDQVTLIAPAQPGDAAFDEPAAFTVKRVWCRVGGKVFTLFSIFNLCVQTLRTLRSGHFDLVYFGKTWPVGLVGPVVRLMGYPYVVHVHGFGVLRPRSTLPAKLLRLVLHRAEIVIANSEHTLRELAKMGVPKLEVAVIYPKVDLERFAVPVDTAAFRKQEDLRDKQVMLTVGRLIDRKGVDLVLRALRKIVETHPNIVYVILGDGPERSNLERLVGELDLSKHVRFPGNRDVMAFFHTCDLFILTSWAPEPYLYESFGIVYLEASACQKPSIGSNCGGIPEAIAENVSGILVNPKREDEIVDALLRLLDDPDLCRRLGKLGYERVVKEFSAAQNRVDIERLVLRPLKLL